MGGLRVGSRWGFGAFRVGLGLAETHLKPTLNPTKTGNKLQTKQHQPCTTSLFLKPYMLLTFHGAVPVFCCALQQHDVQYSSYLLMLNKFFSV